MSAERLRCCGSWKRFVAEDYYILHWGNNNKNSRRDKTRVSEDWRRALWAYVWNLPSTEMFQTKSLEIERGLNIYQDDRQLPVSAAAIINTRARVFRYDHSLMLIVVADGYSILCVLREKHPRRKIFMWGTRRTPLCVGNILIDFKVHY